MTHRIEVAILDVAAPAATVKATVARIGGVTVIRQKLRHPGYLLNRPPCRCRYPASPSGASSEPFALRKRRRPWRFMGLGHGRECCHSLNSVATGHGHCGNRSRQRSGTGRLGRGTGSPGVVPDNLGGGPVTRSGLVTLTIADIAWWPASGPRCCSLSRFGAASSPLQFCGPRCRWCRRPTVGRGFRPAGRRAGVTAPPGKGDPWSEAPAPRKPVACASRRSASGAATGCPRPKPGWSGWRRGTLVQRSTPGRTR